MLNNLELMFDNEHVECLALQGNGRVGDENYCKLMIITRQQ